MSAAPVTSVKSRKQFEQRCASITQEYLILGNVEDAFESFVVCWRKQWLQYFTKASLHVVLDHEISCVESFVTLLMHMHVRGALPHPSIETGVELVLKAMPDVIKDVPQAVQYLGVIIGHLIANNLVPETLVDAVCALAGDELGGRVAAEVRAAVALPLPITTYKKLVDSALLELFASGDVDEACLRIKEAGPKHLGAEAVKRSVIAGVERKGKDRELVSRLLMGLVSSNTIGRDGVMEGFLRVTRRLTDLSLDNPGAAEVVGRFLARAICDEVVAQSMLGVCSDSGPHGKSVSDHARNLLVQPGGRSRIQLLWGAVSDIEQLTEALFGVAEDFIHHRNVDEAMLSFRELDGPGVGHEIVRQVILVSLNHGVEGEELCAKLLGTMFSSNTISRFSMVRGILRCAELVGTVGWKADSLKRIAARFAVPLITASVTSPASPVCSPQPSP